MSNFSVSITSLAIQVSSIPSSTPTYTVSTEYANASCQGGCEIGADKVRLVYWKPEPESSNTSIPSAPFSVVSDDYTFTSPSVYVIYTSLRANCASSAAIQIGRVYDEVTRAYAPEALSTGHCYHTNWSPINYTSLYDPLPDYDVITEKACSMSVSPGQSIDASFFLAGEPLLSMPQDVSLIDPLWASCTAEPAGGYDPPRAQPASSVAAPLPEETGSAPQMTSTPGKASPSRENLKNSNLAASQIPAATSTSEAPNNGNASSPQSSVNAMVPPESQANLQDPGSSIAQSQASAFPNSIVPNLPIILLSGTANPDSSEPILNGPLVAFSGTVDPVSSNPLDPVAGGSVPTSSQDTDPVVGPASGGAFVLGTLTLSPGEQTTQSGHAVSVGSDMVVADGATYTLLSGSRGASLQIVPSSTLNADPVVSPASGGAFVLGTLTLSLGEQTTHAGHAVSVGSDMVVADGATYTVLSGSGGASLQLVPQPTNSGALAAASGTADTGIRLNTYGSASATVTGSPGAPSGSASVASTSTGDGGIGGIIMSALGGNGASPNGTATSGNASSVEPFFAAAARPQRSLIPGCLLLLLGVIFAV
ncbi:hypothetical protein JMJ35_003051 [Cladonia borealis]|uniref:Uncharacterized protein n=1 Tax=Cladonia borealis TaxID=184061 RepID=A0AA39R655_9LECA|nr:hypothetical protein JMJ35_003051 [Cladonia borealis]